MKFKYLKNYVFCMCFTMKNSLRPASRPASMSLDAIRIVAFGTRFTMENSLRPALRPASMPSGLLCMLHTFYNAEFIKASLEEPRCHSGCTALHTLQNEEFTEAGPGPCYMHASFFICLSGLPCLLSTQLKPVCFYNRQKRTPTPCWQETPVQYVSHQEGSRRRQCPP